MKTKKDRANKEDSIKNLPVDVQTQETEGEIIKTVYIGTETKLCLTVLLK